MLVLVDAATGETRSLIDPAELEAWDAQRVSGTWRYEYIVFWDGGSKWFTLYCALPSWMWTGTGGAPSCCSAFHDPGADGSCCGVAAALFTHAGGAPAYDSLFDTITEMVVVPHAMPQ